VFFLSQYTQDVDLDTDVVTVIPAVANFTYKTKEKGGEGMKWRKIAGSDAARFGV
jgi:hypothetical protein